MNTKGMQTPNTIVPALLGRPKKSVDLFADAPPPAPVSVTPGVATACPRVDGVGHEEGLGVGVRPAPRLLLRGPRVEGEGAAGGLNGEGGRTGG